MKNIVTFTKYYLRAKHIQKITQPSSIRTYLKDRKIVANKTVLSAEEINKYLYSMILSEEPFFAGRLGATELNAVRTFDFKISSKYEKAMNQMQKWSGFFPTTNKSGMKFTEMMLDFIPEVDVIGIWMLPFEDYYLNRYGKRNLSTTYLLDLEPWSFPDAPWSSALKGKKVLVIHPFSQTIKKQYARREEIYPGLDILPEFELKTLKAVQTVAGGKDDRFDTWFEALDWMYDEAMKIDFDIAIIGCGAYGFPLAAKIKKAGKQAIHLGGATQLLFGIKGKRWEENSSFQYVQKFFNDSWVYPDVNEKPKNSQIVEGGCYW